MQIDMACNDMNNGLLTELVYKVKKLERDLHDIETGGESSSFTEVKDLIEKFRSAIEDHNIDFDKFWELMEKIGLGTKEGLKDPDTYLHQTEELSLEWSKVANTDLAERLEALEKLVASYHHKAPTLSMSIISGGKAISLAELGQSVSKPALKWSSTKALATLTIKSDNPSTNIAEENTTEGTKNLPVDELKSNTVTTYTFKAQGTSVEKNPSTEKPDNVSASATLAFVPAIYYKVNTGNQTATGNNLDFIYSKDWSRLSLTSNFPEGAEVTVSGPGRLLIAIPKTMFYNNNKWNSAGPDFIDISTNTTGGFGKASDISYNQRSGYFTNQYGVKEDYLFFEMLNDLNSSTKSFKFTLSKDYKPIK